MFLFVLAAQGQETETGRADSNVQWRKYSDSKVEIDFPSDWELDSSTLIGTASNPHGIRFTMSTLTSTEDGFSVKSVLLMISNLAGQNRDLSSLIGDLERIIKLPETKGQIVTSERQTNENGEYHWIIYYIQQRENVLRYEQLVWLIDEVAYFLTYNGEKDDYETDQAMIDNMLNSFKIK